VPAKSKAILKQWKDAWFVSQKRLFPEFDSSSSYVRRLPPAHSVVEVRTIRFVGLPFVFASGGGRRTDAVKPEMIRFVKVTVFSEVQ
jgi:hypothetical protein